MRKKYRCPTKIPISSMMPLKTKQTNKFTTCTVNTLKERDMCVYTGNMYIPSLKDHVENCQHPWQIHCLWKEKET